MANFKVVIKPSITFCIYHIRHESYLTDISLINITKSLVYCFPTTFSSVSDERGKSRKTPVYRTNSNIVMLERQKEPIPGSSVGVTNI